MQKRFKFIGIILSFLLLTLPITSFAQSFGGVLKDNYTVSTSQGDVSVEVELKCIDGGAGEPPFVVELVAVYTNNTSATVDIISSIAITDFNDSDPANDVAPADNGNSQLISNSDSFTNIQITTEVYDSTRTTLLGSSDSNEISAQCSTTAVSLSSVSASAVSFNWLIAAAVLLLGLVTAVVWQRRQNA